jgi:hypothetical protein
VTIAIPSRSIRRSLTHGGGLVNQKNLHSGSSPVFHVSATPSPSPSNDEVVVTPSRVSNA